MLHTPRLQLSWRRPHAVTVLSHPVPAISNRCLVSDNSPSSEALIAQSEVLMRQLEREDATNSKIPHATGPITVAKSRWFSVSVWPYHLSSIPLFSQHCLSVRLEAARAENVLDAD